LPNAFHTRRFGFLLARVAVLLGVGVLVCVPAMTRAGQRLETASHAPSFAKNIDCPPKKVTVAPLPVASPAAPVTCVAVPVVALVPLREARLARSPFLVAPRPLRAPPSAPLA
jgi:hypothetical protein